MADRLIQTKQAIESAKSNGWEFQGVSSGSIVHVIRKTEHSTPQYAMDNGWWPQPTYDTIERLSFVFSDRNRVPKVVHGTSACAWVGRSDQSLSFKAALALLAQSVAESELHDRD